MLAQGDLGDGNQTNIMIRGNAQTTTLPNVFQVRAGTLESQMPSPYGRSGPPFTGIFNVLSQTYDANIGMDELMPEYRDPRYMPQTYDPN